LHHDKMMPKEVAELINSIKSDRRLWAVAPCSHQYRLADSELFYGEELTPRAKEFVDMMTRGLADLRQREKELKFALTEGRTKKSAEVKLGKTVEKICSVLPGFPYEPSDCRALFDPIDYVAFKGLSRGTISRVDFVDIKTGASRLNQRQREIRDAISDGAVRIRRLGD